MPVAADSCLKAALTSGLTSAGRVLGVQLPAHGLAGVELHLVARGDPGPRARAAGGRVRRVDAEAVALAGVAGGAAGGLHEDAHLDLLVVPVRLGLEVEPALAVGLVLVHLHPAAGQHLLEDDHALLVLLALDLPVDEGWGAVRRGGRGPVDLLDLGGHPASGQRLVRPPRLRRRYGGQSGHQGQEGDDGGQRGRGLVVGAHHQVFSLHVRCGQVVRGCAVCPYPRRPRSKPRETFASRMCRMRRRPFVERMSGSPDPLHPINQGDRP